MTNVVSQLTDVTDAIDAGNPNLTGIAIQAASIAGIILLAWLADQIAKRGLLTLINRLAKKSSTHWDDHLIKHRFFHRLSHIAPALVIQLLIPRVVGTATAALVDTGTTIYLLIVGTMVLDALLNSIVDICQSYPFGRQVPIRGLAQVVKLLVVFATAITILSMLMGRSPKFLLSGLGAMTAILMLVFKDAILGFVAGIQLSANRMLQVGDWLEMPKYGADGDVIDISLTTVKVQNWDKTISTIPAYALVSDSFKNWRGMSESDGRRIKRSVYIDMNSIRFCTPEMIERFRKADLLSNYIDRKLDEIQEANESAGIDASNPVNGRHLTNIGTFRAYLVAYLRRHPMINQEMTFLIRHLAPTDQGLPIQIYVFSSDKVWANYEAIQADIFDHILAVVPEFDLRVFQSPSGADFRALTGGES